MAISSVGSAASRNYQVSANDLYSQLKNLGLSDTQINSFRDNKIQPGSQQFADGLKNALRDNGKSDTEISNILSSLAKSASGSSSSTSSAGGDDAGTYNQLKGLGLTDAQIRSFRDNGIQPGSPQFADGLRNALHVNGKSESQIATTLNSVGGYHSGT